MENPAYQHIYNVGLLDDIHNYFPALLYEQGRFQTLPMLFSYIRNQMNTRFNLYSYGASVAARVQPSTTPSPAATREDIVSNIESINFLLNLLQPTSGLSGMSEFVPASRLLRTREAQHEAAWAAFRSPVVVAPSQEVLAANTQLIMGSDLSSNTVCSVCQDSIVSAEACRRITVCQHVYHRTCIDQWFTRSVFCPSCRHDIRQTNLTEAIPVTPNPPSPED